MVQQRQRSSERHWSEWMVAAQKGDSEAYERLLVAILPELRGFVRSRLGDPSSVEDVVQNVLLSIHRARHTFRPERRFAPWLWAIARNAVIDAQRARGVRRRREIPIDGVEEPAQPEPSTVAQPLSPRLRDALARLPEAQREAVEMVRVEGLSVAEAAERAGTTPGALKVRAHRGYRALRALLGSAEDE